MTNEESLRNYIEQAADIMKSERCCSKEERVSVDQERDEQLAYVTKLVEDAEHFQNVGRMCGADADRWIARYLELKKESEYWETRVEELLTACVKLKEERDAALQTSNHTDLRWLALDYLKFRDLLEKQNERVRKLDDAAEMLWVVLANVSGSDWTQQTPEWQQAAARWRDAYFAIKRPQHGCAGD